VRKLQDLVRHLDDLQDLRQQQANRLESGVCTPEVKDSIQNTLDCIDQEIKLIRQHIKEHAQADPELKEQLRLLVSIPGIAETTAVVLIAEVNSVDNFRSARALVAYAGLAPKEHRSGSSIRGRTCLSKVGNARLRECLYFPAIVAKRCNPVIGKFCDRLAES